ncbi:hypothetical protein [Paenibacillus caui]|uniref:hypothetical protein n=1 Tax=Paenibacillus caui TaxID=2873927 RepID=UPI001CAA0426|nr:hypothetical protein [Paenibacillus caui]
MAGKIHFNWLFGGIGFILTFIVSSAHNLLMTSLIRSLIAFVIWFLLAFAIRWIISLPFTNPSSKEQEISRKQGAEEIGSRVDLTTPDESEAISDLLKPSEQASPADQGPAVFEPLNPPRLVKTTDRNPEELAKAVRHLTEE